MVTNEQLYLAIGIPLLFNATLIGVVLAYVNAKFEAMGQKFEAKFQSIEGRLDAIDARFDDMRDVWRAELRRVEGILDARLKYLEERR